MCSDVYLCVYNVYVQLVYRDTELYLESTVCVCACVRVCAEMGFIEGTVVPIVAITGIIIVCILLFML